MRRGEGGFQQDPGVGSPVPTLGFRGVWADGDLSTLEKLK